MKLSFTTLACPAWPMVKIITTAVACGYDGVDFRGYLGEMMIYKIPEFSTQAGSTLRAFRKANLEISGLSSGAKLFLGDSAQQEAALDEVAHYAELCRTFNCPLVRVFPGAIGSTPFEEALEIATASLVKMARLADDILIGVETHDDWVDSSKMLALMEKAGASNACVIWDTHNPYRQIGERPELTHQRLSRHIRYTHFKDSRPAADGSYSYVMPGEGDVPMERIVQMLKASGYDGYLAVEWEKVWHPEIAEPEEVLPAYAKYLRKLI